MSFIETLYLQEQIKRLQEENKRLKSLLEYGGGVSNTMSNLENAISSFDKLNKTVQKVTGTNNKEYKETKKKGLRLDVSRGENKFGNLDTQRTEQSIQKMDDIGNRSGIDARKLLGLE
jgi:predicted RNase H-like nuclease (RuvC/YqgF family)